MFELYTEKARRVIFFSRYEASQFGSPYIETEHLLLGLIREDGRLRRRLSESSSGDLTSLRKQVESQTTIREKISTSVDLPLSHELKRALVYAAEEAKALQHRVIDSGHLVLGLLRITDCLAAALLKQLGIDYEGYKEVVRIAGVGRIPSSEPLQPHGARPFERPSAWNVPEEEEKEPAAPSLGPSIAALQELLDRSIKHLDLSSAGYGEQRLKRSPWSRKEALGHLIDLATAHHQWFARALTEPKLTGALYPGHEWVLAQQYKNVPWPDLVDAWISLNRLSVHVLTLIPEEKLNVSCRIGIEEPISLFELITRYVERCEDIMGQIASRL